MIDEVMQLYYRRMCSIVTNGGSHGRHARSRINTIPADCMRS